jgi:hypothetical protein
MPRTLTATHGAPATRRADRDAPLSDHPVQRIVPANSVFQVAQQQAGGQPRRTITPVPRPDLANVKAYTDRPMPAVQCGRGAQSVYAVIYERHLTRVGASVDLTPRQAKSMISWGKKAGKKLAVRAVAPDVSGVWRVG